MRPGAVTDSLAALDATSLEPLYARGALRDGIAESLAELLVLA